MLEDITHMDGTLRAREDMKQTQLTRRHKATYQKLCTNLDLTTSVVLGNSDIVDIFVTGGRPKEGDWHGNIGCQIVGRQHSRGIKANTEVLKRRTLGHKQNVPQKMLR